jgi:hypothetical protein
MKTLISTRPAFFTAALVITLSFGCGEGIEGETGSQSAELINGQCNAIVASSLRTAQECQRISCEPGSDQCMEALDTLTEFAFTPGCLAAFGDGELNGLPGNASIQPAGPNAEAAKHIGVVVCEAVDDCNLCEAALSFGICTETCTPIP